MWEWVAVVGFIATIIWCCVLIPQAYKTIKTKNVCSVSFIMFFLYPFNGLLWLTWGIISIVYNPAIFLTMLPNLINSTIGLVLSITILVYKIKYMIAAKKMKISEVEYYEQHLRNKKENKIILKMEAWFKAKFIKQKTTTLQKIDMEKINKDFDNFVEDIKNI